LGGQLEIEGIDEIIFYSPVFKNLNFKQCRQVRNGTAHFKNVKDCLNTNIYSYLETSGGQSSNPYLNFAFFQQQC